MAKRKTEKIGFCKLLSNAQITATNIIKNTITSLTANHTVCHAKENYKTTSHCIAKDKNFTTSCNNNRCSKKYNSKNSGTSNIDGSSSYSQSLSFFYLSCHSSPKSIITFITTTIYWSLRNVHNIFWRFMQQRQQQQYKTEKKTSHYFFCTPSINTPMAATITNSNFYTTLKWYFFLWLFLSILAPCISLTMTEVRIPKHIMRHENAALGCKYDLDGESLYSVKWYKDGFEFYRYVPRDMPPGQVFPLPGVDVDLQNSTDNVVVLNRVNLQSTGRYRCEVSGEAPSFQTVSGHEDMIVVVTPLKGPQITGGQPRYSIGEKVSVNCTSAPSKPICHLSWLINGVHANRSFLRYHEPKIVGREGLEVATLGLEFRVRG